MARGTINILQNAWILAHINLFLYVDNSQPSALGIWLECQNINIKAITEYVKSDLHVKEKRTHFRTQLRERGVVIECKYPEFPSFLAYLKKCRV